MFVGNDTYFLRLIFGSHDAEQETGGPARASSELSRVLSGIRGVSVNVNGGPSVADRPATVRARGPAVEVLILAASVGSMYWAVSITKSLLSAEDAVTTTVAECDESQESNAIAQELRDWLRDARLSD